MGLFNANDKSLINKVIKPFKEKVDNANNELLEYMNSYPTTLCCELTTNCKCRYKIPFFCGKNVKKQYKDIYSQYKSMVECVHFGLNQSTKEFTFVFISSELEFTYKKYSFNDFIGFNTREKKSYETDSDLTVYTINGNETSSISGGNGTSSTEESFNSGILILKFKNQIDPLLRIELYCEDEYDMLRSYLEIILESK